MKKNASQTKNEIPFVSVIIPAFNGKDRLLLLLKSLENQSASSFEVVVVDDGSTDGTRDAVMGLKKTYPVALSYYYLDNTGIFGAGIARNHGAKQAKGNILLFLDQDCVCEQNLIRNHIAFHKTRDIILGYFAGYGNEEECYDFAKLNDCVQQGRAVPVIKEFRDHLFDGGGQDDAWKCFVSAHFSIKKKIFRRFCFDESFVEWGCEDIDLGYRLFQAGQPIYFEKECVVYNSSEEPMLSKKKFQSLSKSLLRLYSKNLTPEIKLYCLERFYNSPLKYRDSLQLIVRDKDFEIRRSDTKIVIGKDLHAQVACGADFSDVTSTIESIIPLIKHIDFGVSVIKTLGASSLSDFRNAFHRLIRALRDNKISINLDAIRKQSFLMGVRLVGPALLSLDFYDKCNEECLFCFIHSPIRPEKRRPPLTLDAVKEILDQSYEIGVQQIRFSSDGEPLFSPNALNILEDIVNKGFNIQLLTNGTLLREKHVSLLNKIPYVDVLINFSAATKPTYQKVHGGHHENFDSVLNSFALLAELKKARKKGDVHIATTFIITKLNYREIADYIPFVKSLGVDYVYFKLAILYEEAEDLLISDSEISKFKLVVLRAMDRAAKLSFSTNLDEILGNIHDSGFRKKNDIKKHSLNMPSKNCYNGWFFARVNPNGNYYICGKVTVPLGNVTKDSFKGVFFSEKMKDTLTEGINGISLTKKIWSKCNYCYHLKVIKMAKEWLDKHEAPHTCY
ncbi:MAG: glycosyltransferase [Candidatus Omnitrophota bacterium]